MLWYSCGCGDFRLLLFRPFCSLRPGWPLTIPLASGAAPLAFGVASTAVAGAAPSGWSPRKGLGGMAHATGSKEYVQSSSPPQRVRAQLAGISVVTSFLETNLMSWCDLAGSMFLTIFQAAVGSTGCSKEAYGVANRFDTLWFFSVF